MSFSSYRSYGQPWSDENHNIKGCIINNVIYGDTTVVGIEENTSHIAVNYSLSQNYPNPFNPTTKIKFDILSSPHVLGGDLVQLKVYDITGREIQTLVNEKLSPGTYETSFDGSQFASGIYFYQLIVNNQSFATKKMTLLK